MNPHHIIFFVLLPMAAGILTLLFSRHRIVQRLLGLAFLTGNLALAATALMTVYAGADQPGRVLVSQMGNWPAPFGITIAVDPLAAAMLVVGATVALAVFLYCINQLGPVLEGGYFHPIFHLLLFGVQWSFITGDLFNLFVAFEIMLMASYAMFTIGTTRAQMRQAYKYILLNLIGSTMFVTCAGLLYGHLGTLNMADITRMAMTGQLPARSVPVIALFLAVFGGKTAIFPLWFWLPETYPTLPAPIVGLFAGMLTKVGAYVLIRFFVMMFGQGRTADGQLIADVIAPILLVSAGVTMFVGVLGAVSMHTVRSILSIHIISQIGYMILGIGLAMGAVAGLAGDVIDAKVLAVAGAIFFILHNMVVKCCLFLCGGLIQEHAGSDDLDRIGGLVKRAPWLGVLFLLAALSLAGLPPLSGFFGKWVLIRQSFVAGHNSLVVFALATSILTLLSMLKIWSYGFWSPAQGRHVDHPRARPRVAGGMLAVSLLVAVALSMGLLAPWYMNVCIVAGRGVVNPRGYISAVLGPAAVADIDARLSRLAAPDPHLPATGPVPARPALATGGPR